MKHALTCNTDNKIIHSHKWEDHLHTLGNYTEDVFGASAS